MSHNPRGSDHTAMELLQADVRGSGEWTRRHAKAWLDPRGPEAAIVDLLVGWALYADVHYERFGSSIGDDGVLGPEWEAIGRALLGLLNGELGRLDAGTLDGRIREILEHEGFEEE